MTDTRVLPALAKRIQKADLLYHEATFLHELLERAEKTYHTTAKEAGEFARLASVEKLIIGHFSTRYQNLNPLLKEAKSYFPATSLAEEGSTFSVAQKDD
jgi:ribonuclease Z